MLTQSITRLRGETDRERSALLLALLVGFPLFATLNGIFLFNIVVGIVGMAILVAVGVNALIHVRRVPRLVVSGLVGGGVAGLIALGAGSRLAMRVVALTGGRREVSIDGTMFLLIAGAMLGAMIGLTLAGLLRLWRARGLVVGTVLMVSFGSLLLLGSDTRQELSHEGLGLWLNLPMFLGPFLLYGVLAVRSIRGVETRLPVIGLARHPVPESN